MDQKESIAARTDQEVTEKLKYSNDNNYIYSPVTIAII